MPELTEKPSTLNLLALILLIPAGIYLARTGIGLSVALAVLGAAQGFAMKLNRRRLHFGISCAILLWIAATALWALIRLFGGGGFPPLLLTAIFTAVPAVCAWWSFKALRP